MVDHWESLSSQYEREDWSTKPSIFATEIHEYIPTGARILELGCGQGQDGLWFADEQNRFHVLATDISSSALENAQKRKAELEVDAIEFERLDLAELFRYPDEIFDMVYSHLGLHYFDKTVTERLFAEIYRVLKPRGVLAFLANSVNDPEYGTGIKIEDDYFETAGTKKRYFSASTALDFTKNFDVILCDEDGETYKDRKIGVHNLVRFVGRKK
ncbi:MAG TPA: class I SAM-dependent methyltransferase [Candidatus Saccharimonadales bacterium]